MQKAMSLLTMGLKRVFLAFMLVVMPVKPWLNKPVLAAADGCLAALEAEKFVHGRKAVRPQYS